MHVRRVTLPLSGHLSRESLDAAIGQIEDQLSMFDPCHLVVDALEMTGYTGEARQRFVDFAREHGDALGRISILTTKPLWRVVISAMSLASGKTMRPYASHEELAQAEARA